MNDQDLTQLDRQARDVFLGAVETHGAEARAAYLETACRDDPALRAVMTAGCTGACEPREVALIWQATCEPPNLHGAHRSL
jgi:hypothetical protein